MYYEHSSCSKKRTKRISRYSSVYCRIILEPFMKHVVFTSKLLFVLGLSRGSTTLVVGRRIFYQFEENLFQRTKTEKKESERSSAYRPRMP
jgi:hypothetical protein